MFRVSLALLLALACSCSEDPPQKPSDAVLATDEDLTLESPGAHPPELARRRFPRLILLRRSDGLHCSVESESEQAFSWAELLRPAAPVERWSRNSPDDDTGCTFLIPLDARGRLIVRIGYPDGETWRHEIEL